MGLMDKIKKGIGPNDQYDAYDDDYDAYDEAFESDSDTVDGQGADDLGAQGMGAAMGGISLSGSSGASLELKVVKPRDFNSVPQIAEHLLSKRTVVLNLENTNKETARRLIDFLSGVAFSIDGALKKISANVYVITPNNVDVGDAQLRENRARQERERPAEKDPMADIDTGDLSDF